MIKEEDLVFVRDYEGDTPVLLTKMYKEVVVGESYISFDTPVVIMMKEKNGEDTVQIISPHQDILLDAL